MKLKKEEFKRDDIDAVIPKIVGMLVGYVEENKLVAYKNNYCDKSINITHNMKNVSTYGEPTIINFKNTINTEFKLLDDKLHPSHKIFFPLFHKINFYFDALKELNEFEKIVFIKTMFDFRPSLSNFSDARANVSENDFFLHLRHIVPFSKTKQKQNSDDVRYILQSLASKNIDTQEKVESLAYFLKYYKTIAKKTDIKAGLVRLIKNKIDEDYFPIFESILSLEIKKGISEVDIFAQAPETKTLIIPKETLFEQLHFAQLPQAQNQHYNSYFLMINNFLLSSKAKEKTNISRIDFHELTNSEDPARIYIQAEATGFKEDVQQVYNHLLKTCNHHYDEKKDRINDALEKSFDYYFLNKALGDKPLSNNNSVGTKRSMKI